MKVSLNLVKKYVDLSGLTPEVIADRLTFAGVEVESIEHLASGSKLVVGEVLTCENMPDSDHLHLTTVNVGPKYGVLHIVCGAPNVRKGLKVIVALDGCVLPGGTIKKGKIRGYDSEGMLCSLLELGVDAKFLNEEQTKGIEELAVGEVGDENVLALLGLDDVILDLKLLANRSDLYSIKNVAKEIETLFGNKAHFKELNKVKGKKNDIITNSLTPSCPQFSSMVVNDIKIKESPAWLKEALRSSGIRSINNIVDIGNYVMLLTGQPLHMYDLDKLPKKELIVKDDYEGDFIALDEKTYKLQKGDIVITSDNKVMCLGGVMGSLACAIDDNSKNVVVEAANFNFASIRRTSTRLALVSDSSQRFVKGINPNQYDDVMALTLDLLVKLADAKDNSEVTTYLAKEYVKKHLKSSCSYINARLGTDFDKTLIKDTLRKAFIEIKEINDDEFEAIVPDSRIDITHEADLSEEVIRIIGFDKIVSTLPEMKLSVGGLDENVAKKRVVRNYLRGLGLDEELTYTLVNEKEATALSFFKEEVPYKVMNPLTDDRAYVRTNLLPSLMNALVYNINHDNLDGKIFEVSDIFADGGKKHIRLGVILYGADRRRGKLVSDPYNFYDMKGIVEGLINLFDIDAKRVIIARANKDSLHTGKSAVVKLDNKEFAYFGELHPFVKEAYGLKDNVLVLEADLDVLFNVKTGQKKMSELSRFPSVNHDLALVVKKGITSEEVIKEIYKVNRELIKNVEVFDVYEGEHMLEGYYSLAISLTYSSLEKTLTTEEVAALESNVIKNLETKFGITLRK